MNLIHVQTCIAKKGGAHAPPCTPLATGLQAHLFSLISHFLISNACACSTVIFLVPSLDGSFVLKEFASTFEGIMSSFITRYPNYDAQLESLWNKDQHYWTQK